MTKIEEVINKKADAAKDEVARLRLQAVVMINRSAGQHIRRVREQLAAR